MKRVLITGGTGFVGRWMAQTIPLEIGTAEYFYMSRQGYQNGDWQVDVWDYIVHLAPVNPTRVLQHLKEQGRGRLLYCSSGAVYHETPDRYGISKRLYEHECLASGVDVVIARPFSFFGDHLDEGKALSRFIRAAKLGEPLRIYADGSTVRSYMSGESLGRLMWAILLHGKSGEAYDVGSEKPVTILELAQMVVKAFRSESPIIIENRPDRVPVYLPRDMAKTWALLKPTS